MLREICHRVRADCHGDEHRCGEDEEDGGVKQIRRFHRFGMVCRGSLINQGHKRTPLFHSGKSFAKKARQVYSAPDMADEQQPDKVWDEYDWERFLQQQDRKTEKYMELLEKYIDHPDRDQIIAREMGWTHLLNEDGERWAEEVEELFEEEMQGSGDEGDEDDDAAEDEDNEDDDYEVHPLYQAAFALTVWLDQLFDEREDLQVHHSAVKLSTQAAICSAKLAAALSDDDIDEIGMTIAYLKRALKAITSGMEAALVLRKEVPLDEERYATLQQRLFQIRDAIIDLMGAYRAEFRRRYGAL